LKLNISPASIIIGGRRIRKNISGVRTTADMFTRKRKTPIKSPKRIIILDSGSFLARGR